MANKELGTTLRRHEALEKAIRKLTPKKVGDGFSLYQVLRYLDLAKEDWFEGINGLKEFLAAFPKKYALLRGDMFALVQDRPCIPNVRGPSPSRVPLPPKRWFPKPQPTAESRVKEEVAKCFIDKLGRLTLSDLETKLDLNEITSAISRT